MSVETHVCEICHDFRGEHEEVVNHIENEHDKDEESAEKFIEPLPDEGL